MYRKKRKKREPSKEYTLGAEEREGGRHCHACAHRHDSVSLRVRVRVRVCVCVRARWW